MRFHFLARGIIYQDGKVLLAHQKGADHTFLPGGHIGMGEKAEAALLREIVEEIGENAIIRRFIGAVECTFTENEQVNHELNLIFEVSIPNLDPSKAPESKEAHLEFMWVKPTQLKAKNLLPDPMIKCLMIWEVGYQAYWGSSFGDTAQNNQNYIA